MGWATVTSRRSVLEAGPRLCTSPPIAEPTLLRARSAASVVENLTKAAPRGRGETLLLVRRIWVCSSWP